ncbi:hypothetical protein RMATCC62417_13365 [Rhizopus microsporus]|nr:hypothetical protein RMATCC62417_13365 [Rhizopus microsporus]
MDSTSTSSTQPETVYVTPQQPEPQQLQQPQQQQPTVTTTLQEQQPQQQQQPQQPSPPTSQDQEEECSILSPTLADILSDDRILRFYQCVLVNTNWEAIRRRLTIGERIYQVCDILGRGFLLLSKQVSGRKLLHNFNAGEWAEFMREFRKPENQALLDNLQARYNPTRFYGQPQGKEAVITVAEVTPTPAEQ